MDSFNEIIDQKSSWISSSM